MNVIKKPIIRFEYNNETKLLTKHVSENIEQYTQEETARWVEENNKRILSLEQQLPQLKQTLAVYKLAHKDVLEVWKNEASGNKPTPTGEDKS